MWQIEQGGADNPKAATVIALAEALGCTVGWLLAGEGAPPSAESVRAAVEKARSGRGAPVGSVFTASDFTREAVARDDEDTGPVVVREGFDQTGAGA